MKFIGTVRKFDMLMVFCQYLVYFFVKKNIYRQIWEHYKRMSSITNRKYERIIDVTKEIYIKPHNNHSPTFGNRSRIIDLSE